MAAQDDQAEQQRILTFWLGDDPFDPAAVKQCEGIWYDGSSELDREIRAKFGSVFERACSESLLHWCDSTQGALALVILLDQFSRNLHRGTAKAFAQDALARAVSKRAINTELDKEMSVIGRIFLLHPFHHSESILDQDYACIKIDDLIEEGHPDWKDTLDSTHSWFRRHRDIVRRFARFPHRNEVLGRESTSAELLYLTNSRHFGQ